MSEFIFTFGANHRHPVTGESLGRRFVAIEAPTHEAATAQMNSVFGEAWSLAYSSRESAGVERFGLVRLDLEEVRTATKKAAN